MICLSQNQWLDLTYIVIGYKVNRGLPQQSIRPPLFYYKNAALAPKGVWETISRFFYDIEPKFVDSKNLCAIARKRGNIHNLPIDNRFSVLPLPPKTIFETFSYYLNSEVVAFLGLEKLIQFLVDICGKYEINRKNTVCSCKLKKSTISECSKICHGWV